VGLASNENEEMAKNNIIVMNKPKRAVDSKPLNTANQHEVIYNNEIMIYY